MKIITLFPVRNEEWILRTTIPQMKKFSDEILCLDAGSVDSTREILKGFDVEYRDGSDCRNDYSESRQRLLDWGRERGGTHFVWLDADEVFTSNFMSSFKDVFLEMKPGQKLMMQWLCLWKDPHKYREDGSVWSGLFKDFVFCDDGISSFKGGAQLHEGRTPGKRTKKNILEIPLGTGAVLHFQFAAFERFQMKQAFQRCRELFLCKEDPLALNNRYSITMDDSNAKCKDIPAGWLEGIKGLEGLGKAGIDWYFLEIIRMFDKKGIAFFELLQIWHVPQLHDEFIKIVGREPKPLLKGTFGYKVMRKLKKIMKVRY